MDSISREYARGMLGDERETGLQRNNSLQTSNQKTLSALMRVRHRGTGSRRGSEQ